MHLQVPFFKLRPIISSRDWYLFSLDHHYSTYYNIILGETYFSLTYRRTTCNGSQIVNLSLLLWTKQVRYYSLSLFLPISLPPSPLPITPTQPSTPADWTMFRGICFWSTGEPQVVSNTVLKPWLLGPLPWVLYFGGPHSGLAMAVPPPPKQRVHGSRRSAYLEFMPSPFHSRSHSGKLKSQNLLPKEPVCLSSQG